MKTVFHSHNLIVTWWYGVLAFCIFVGNLISLWIHPERFGFVIASITGFIAVLLFTIQIVFLQNAELIVNNMIFLGGFTSENTVTSYKVEKKTLVSVELFDGILTSDQMKKVSLNSGINVYQVPGSYYIIHEVCDFPFYQRDTVRVYEKK